MIERLFGLMLLLAILSCNSNGGYAYSLEDEIFECWKEYSIKKGYDLEKGIYDLESLLIEHDFLNGRNGTDYIEYCNLFSNAEKFESLLTPEFINETKEVVTKYPNNVRCEDSTRVDTSDLQKSRIGKIVMMFKNIDEDRGINMESIGQSWLKTFSPEDLGHNLYKHCVLSITVYYLSMGGIFSEKRNDYLYEYSGDDSQKDNILHILVNEEGKTLVDSVEVELNEIKQKVQFFLENVGYKEVVFLDDIGKQEAMLGVIKLEREKKTPYDSYLETYHEVQDVFSDLINQYALKLYNKPYEALSREEKRNVSYIFPRRLH